MFYIKGPVGNNLANDERDVVAVKDALESLKIFHEKERNGFITRGLDSAIKSFQKEKRLRIDGLLFPEGETENAVRESLSAASQEENDMLVVPPGSVESESLPKRSPMPEKVIPGTNIPDRSIPEQGFPESRMFDPYKTELRGDKMVDPYFSIDPPYTAFDFRMPVIRKKRLWGAGKKDI